MKNLKAEYRKVIDNNGETGSGRKTCRFYRELDGILGHRPASVPSILLDTATGTSATTESQSEEREDEFNGTYKNYADMGLSSYYNTEPFFTCR